MEPSSPLNILMSSSQVRIGRCLVLPQRSGIHSQVLASGVGLGICERLIDDFLRIKPLSSHLTIIFTTRSATKASDTLDALRMHLSYYGQSAHSFVSRIHFRPENVDLTNLLSIRALSQRLLHAGIPKLDAIILNAGMGAFTGIDWPVLARQLTMDLVQAVTWPAFKLCGIGYVTKPQLPPGSAGEKIPEPPLGEVFCANVFGHYMLVHGLTPLLWSGSDQSPGRIIWVSSIESSASHFESNDLQGLTSQAVYTHTKRLTDLLALTATDQPATAKAVDAFLKPGKPVDSSVATSTKPKILVTHPGVCATAIMPAGPLQYFGTMLAMYMARLIGSPWHPTTAYSGAHAPVWLALAPYGEIEAKQFLGSSGSVKWGSATDRLGNEYVQKTDIDGWGIDGSGKPIDWWNPGGWGRARGARDATREDVEAFVEQGGKVWREMEALRVQWEGTLDEHEKK